MDGSHPKRKKDKYNPYTLIEDNGKYYVHFKDGTGAAQRIPLNADLYKLFDCFELEDISHMNEVSRHLEQSELTEESLNARSFFIPPTVEETVFLSCEKEALHKAIWELSDNQRRRLYLYYWEGLTFEQIGKLEGCTHPAVIKSINGATKKIEKILSEQGYNLTDK